jgi:hypothetical protein
VIQGTTREEIHGVIATSRNYDHDRP